MCAQGMGRYNLYNDLWGESYATFGSQTTEDTSYSNTTFAWKTTYTCEGASSNVKSCTSWEFLQIIGTI
jgi:xyloglucan-specific endo-beta-1,4-glucanase